MVRESLHVRSLLHPPGDNGQLHVPTGKESRKNKNKYFLNGKALPPYKITELRGGSRQGQNLFGRMKSLKQNGKRI